MKNKVWKRLLSTSLAAMLAFSGNAAGGLTNVYAADEEEVVSSDVITAEETIKVNASDYANKTNNFNSGWKFYLGTSGSAQQVNFNDSAWETVDLPHDFSISQGFTTSGEAESGFLPGGTGWYRKSFTLPESAEGKTVVINFDGVYSDAYIYVNGTLAGEHHYGYTSFAVDLTDYLICDGTTENVIAVRAVNSIPTSRWYSGSGIYRDVTLTIENSVHVARYGTQVTTPDIASGSGRVKIVTEVENDAEEDASVTVRNTILDGDGNVVSAASETSVSVAAGSAVEVEQADLAVSGPALWSIDSPNLYTVLTELLVDGEAVDTYTTEFGFRYFSFDSQGFHLNGENVKLNGVCLHHDQGALGSAAYYDSMYRQLVSMKEMGANAIRTSHNPADEDFIKICNELGLLVIEEAFDGWTDAKNGNSNDFSTYFNKTLGSSNHLIGGRSDETWAEFAVRSMVRRDRNNPSIILWSLGNEIAEGTSWSSTSSFASVARNLITWIREEDSSRPTTSGDNNRGENAALVNVLNTILDNGGVSGFNYTNSASELSSMVSQFGGSNHSIIASETSSAVNSRGIYSSLISNANADGKYHLTSYDTSAVGWGITAHESIYLTYTNDQVAGEFVWTGWDYIGEPTPWNQISSGASDSGQGASPNSSYFGIVDTAGFEKDTYYLYSAQWNKDVNTLHLVTAWDSNNMYTSSGKTPVVIYSNAPVVKLYRDGTLIGTAARMTNTSSAGHTYYTYSCTSNSSSVCTADSGSGSSALYASFQVAYKAGTISAKAYEADGTTEITDTVGTSSVSTPGSASELSIHTDGTELTADGETVRYISVDVTDEEGNLITTADNEISFTLTGAGEIAGVDNGDQTSTDKYQQSSVLIDSKTAKIKAYAGKALCVIRSTHNEGAIQVHVSSGNLTGSTAEFTSHAPSDSSDEAVLKSYTMIRDYTVKLGTVPELSVKAAGNLSDDETVDGEIQWEEIPAETATTAGDYTVNGTLDFGIWGSFSVSCRIHVVQEVAALRNIAVVTAQNSLPTLPDQVTGVLFDGTVTGEYAVSWEAITAEQFAVVGDIITVHGTASIFGEETLPVTASVRIAEAVNTESYNVAPQVLSLEQDIPAASQSDVLNSIINGTTKPGDDTSERWTNWNNRTTSDTAVLTFSWATAQVISSVNLYYYIDNCSNVAESVTFEYSLDGSTYTEIEASAELVETYSLGKEYSHTFVRPVNPISLRITLVQQDGTTGAHCVGLTEAEIMTYSGTVEAQSSAVLSSITVDGTAVADVNPDTLEYQADVTGEHAVEAVSDSNVGITVLPEVSGGIVRILTVSEDGSSELCYVITLNDVCIHEKTSVAESVDATCTEDGYTGDEICDNCGEMITEGSVIPAIGHAYGEPAWNWEVDGTATSIFSCVHDSVHTVTVEASVDIEETDTGYLYTAFVEFEGRTYTDSKEEEIDPIPFKNPFVDVKESNYYYDAVLWAAENNITSGIDATHFGPQNKVTRAQVVTFLWKASGSPEPTTTENPFTDVKKSSSYYKPILWAAENGITSGTDATHFSPSKECTRAQIVTFLWKYAGSPEPTITENPFSDVSKNSGYYRAILWAYENKITAGTGKQFSTNAVCTRAQTVVLLYHYANL